MPSLVVIGAQWGDEGKGKLVDYLTAKAQWVVRFQGGNNAGHTLVVDGVKTKLSLVPSGILHPGTRCALAAGVVVDCDVLLSEIEGLRRVGTAVTPERLLIDRDAHIILEYHRAIDKAREEQLGDRKIGTTGRGIGPAYEDRAGRCGVRFADLFTLEDLRPRVESIVTERNKYLRHVLQSSTSVEFDAVWQGILRAREALLPHIANVSALIDGALEHDERVVFEGAQGTLLDQTFGTVPFVTSSSTLAGAATTGTGLGPKRLNYVLGVAKAYSTRVGSGPFPTELFDETGDRIRSVGQEFGTVTGRPRRCGWFDAVAMRRAVRLNGVDSLAITKLDVLAGLDKVRVCIKYHLDGKEIDDVPALPSEIDRVIPEYIELDGWGAEAAEATKWYQLPAAAKLYVATVGEIVGAPVTVASVGAERRSTLFSSGANFVKNFVE